MAADLLAGSIQSRRLRLIDICVAIACVAATLCWSFFAGKDLNFDQLSYHFYLPYNLFGNRLEQDFLAANGQSYLNPLPYVPFYLMVRADFPSLLIASILATLHSLNVILTYVIGRALLPAREGVLLPLLGACLAFMSPMYLLEAGSTFTDITTAALVLGAVFLLVRNDRSARQWKVVVAAGVIFGAATGLKLSNAIFAPPLALTLAIVVYDMGAKRTVQLVSLLAFGSMAGYCIVHGYWGWKLWQEFGNPFFPLFNATFPSPDYPAMGGAQQRFLPQSFFDYFTLPFRMASVRAWIYIESSAPDLRAAALSLLAVAAPVAWLVRRNKSVADKYPLDRRGIALVAFVVAGYFLWLATSGNGRYGIVLSLLVGPVLVLMARHVGTQKGALVAAAILGILQLLHLQNAQLRWVEGRWTPSWYHVSVPERLQREPYLYVSVGGNANSYLYPFLAEASAFTNPIGQISIELDGPGGQRLQRLFKKHEGRVRVIGLMPDMEDSSNISRWPAGDLIGRLGFAIDSNDCETIMAAGASHEPGQNFDNKDADVRRFLTCRIVPQPFALEAERQRVHRIASEIAAWCPKLFQPSYSVVERQQNGWFVNYPSTDVVLAVRDGEILVTQMRAMAHISLGSLSTWEQGLRPECAKMPNRLRDAYGAN